jgi:crotonobetainyl-CoA:carnitine CoA-transferase CaiB-like acyl-CoA transferase
MTDLWGGYSHSSLVDYVAAEHGVVAVLAALLYRESTGRGVHIDMAQVEVAAAAIGAAYLEQTVNGRTSAAGNRGYQPGAPVGCYPCQGDDAWCVIEVTSDAEWRRFREGIGDAEWAADPRFECSEGRIAAAREIDERVSSWTRQRTPAEVEERLQRVGVPAGAVVTPADVVDDPHLRHRGFYSTVEHPVFGPWEYPGIPIRLSETPGRIRRHAPMLGQDNGYVFGEVLGLSSAEIAELEAEGVLA